MSTLNGSTNAIEVFFSYSHKDEDLRDALADHLSILKRQGAISAWYDREITAGTEWEGEISTHLQTANIILLLVSANFIASDYCYDVELTRAMERHEKGEARVIPVILRPVDWHGAPFGKLRPLPKNGEPITSKRWDSLDEAFLDVARGIRLVAEQLRQEQRKSREVAQMQAISASPAASEPLASPKPERPTREETAPVAQPSRTVGTAVHDRPDQRPTPAPIIWTRRRLLQYAGLGGVGVAGALAIHQITSDRPAPTESPQGTAPEQSPPTVVQSPPSLENLTFEVSTVDARGKVVERDEHSTQFFKESLGNGIFLDMVAIPAGDLHRGSPDDEEGSQESERPRYWVRNIPPFFMSRFTITQAQWNKVAEGLPQVKINLQSKPSHFKFEGDNRPVEQVSWDEANEFCARLTQDSGINFRLPSEVEWEYACRGETDDPFHFGQTITTDLANYDGRSPYAAGPTGKPREEPIEVGSLGTPNKFGLHDMHGNVWEWCADLWHDDYKNAPKNAGAWNEDGDPRFRVVRGGSWGNPAGMCRSASRFKFEPGIRRGDVGFRVVCTFPATQT